MTEPMIGDADEVRQILVHPVVWSDLVAERYGYTTWAEAFRSACEHMRGCP